MTTSTVLYCSHVNVLTPFLLIEWMPSTEGFTCVEFLIPISKQESEICKKIHDIAAMSNQSKHLK